MYDRVKGFRDVYPDEMEAQREVIETVETMARRYGFREIATPALERTELYVEKSGEGIVDELFAFDDQGGRAVSLTPELTPTVARMVVERGQELSKPIKWYSTRPFWRYEQVQQGRFREFYQTNVDILGSSEPTADAEILAFAADSLRELGLEREDFVFKISHREILERMLQAYGEGIDVTAGMRAVDKRDDHEHEAYLEGLVDAGFSEADAVAFDDLLDAANADPGLLLEELDDDRLAEAVAELEEVLEAVERFGARDVCEISLETARGLDYYTGVVFECFDTTGDVSRATFGGGRYDELIESLGGPSTPAVGVALGIMNSTLPLLLKRAGVWPAEGGSIDYYVLGVGDTADEVATLAQTLRGNGHTVEIDLADRGFGGQLSYADSRGAETVIVAGERDLADGEVTIKEMASGDQVAAPYEAVLDADTPRYADFSGE